MSASSLLLVGEMSGHFDGQKDMTRHRAFDLIYEQGENDGEFRVAEAGLVTQSFAADVGVSPLGRAIISGYRCNDNCLQSEAYLQMLDAQGKLVGETGTGIHAFPTLASGIVRWSPAEYVVVAFGGTLESDAGLLLRVYEPGNAEPGDAEPLWIDSRQGAKLQVEDHRIRKIRSTIRGQKSRTPADRMPADPPGPLGGLQTSPEVALSCSNA